MEGPSEATRPVSLRPNASGDVMNILILGTVLFAASALCFGFAYLFLRNARPGSWRDSDMLASLICVGLTGMIVMALITHAIVVFDWKDAVAGLSLPAMAGLAAVDAAALVAATGLLTIARRRAARAPAVVVVEMTPGTPPKPANSPTRPRRRAA
jgi:hypothetical protein